MATEGFPGERTQEELREHISSRGTAWAKAPRLGGVWGIQGGWLEGMRDRESGRRGELRGSSLLPRL